MASREPVEPSYLLTKEISRESLDEWRTNSEYLH